LSLARKANRLFLVVLFFIRRRKVVNVKHFSPQHLKRKTISLVNPLVAYDTSGRGQSKQNYFISFLKFQIRR